MLASHLSSVMRFCPGCVTIIITHQRMKRVTCKCLKKPCATLASNVMTVNNFRTTIQLFKGLSPRIRALHLLQHGHTYHLRRPNLATLAISPLMETRSTMCKVAHILPRRLILSRWKELVTYLLNYHRWNTEPRRRWQKAIPLRTRL